MSTAFGRPTQHLSRVGLTLAPRRRPVRRLVASAVVVTVALAAGFAAGELLRERAPAAPAPAPVSGELAPLRQQLEQARMGLRVADARSHELERQIDTLNQKLTEAQDELSFFRKAREPSRGVNRP